MPTEGSAQLLHMGSRTCLWEPEASLMSPLAPSFTQSGLKVG